MYTLVGYGDAGIPFFFSEESTFSLQRCDDRVRVFRRINAMLIIVFLNEIVSGVGGSVMVWAAIDHCYRSPLVVIEDNLNAQRYRDDILAHHVIPLFHNNTNISIFQHDNATGT